MLERALAEQQAQIVERMGGVMGRLAEHQASIQGAAQARPTPYTYTLRPTPHTLHITPSAWGGSWGGLLSTRLAFRAPPRQETL